MLTLMVTTRTYALDLKSRVAEWCVYRNSSIGSWDVSLETNMSGLFEDYPYCDPPIETWNTRRVRDMSHMFDGSLKFNRAIGSTWNVSSVVNMANMFRGTGSFNQDLSKWTVPNLRTSQGMFMASTAFNQAIFNPFPKQTDYMFFGARAYRRRKCIQIKSTNMFNFSGCEPHCTDLCGAGICMPNRTTDVGFILDQSSSMTNREDKIARDFIIKIVNMYFNSSKTRYSLVSFSGKVNNEIRFESGLNASAFVSAVGSLKRTASSTNTGVGLLASASHFSKNNTNYKLAILLSDGQPNAGPDHRVAFNALKNVTNYTVLIRIGMAIRADIFNFTENLNLQASVDTLGKLSDMIGEAACPNININSTLCV